MAKKESGQESNNDCLFVFDIVKHVRNLCFVNNPIEIGWIYRNGIINFSSLYNKQAGFARMDMITKHNS